MPDLVAVKLSKSTASPRRGGEQPIKELNSMFEMSRMYEELIETYRSNGQAAHEEWLKTTCSHVMHLRCAFKMNSHDFGGDPFTCMVMPAIQCPGGECFELLKNNDALFGSMHMDHVRRVFGQLVRALHFLHETCGTAHRFLVLCSLF